MREIKPFQKIALSAMIGAVLGLVVVRTQGISDLFERGPAHPVAMRPDLQGASAKALSLTARMAGEYNRQLIDAGAFREDQANRAPLLSTSGSIDEKVMESLDLEPAEEIEVRRLLRDTIGETSRLLANRLGEDPRRNIAYGDEWETLHIKGDPEAADAMLDQLRLSLETACGDTKTNRVLAAFDAPTQLAFLGRSDVFLQKLKGLGSGHFEGRVEFFDPVTGTKLREVEVSGREQLDGLLGPQAAAALTGDGTARSTDVE